MTTDDDDETRRTKRVLTAALWVTLPNPWPLMLLMLAADAPLAVLTVSASFFSAAAALVTIWRRPLWFLAAIHTVIAANIAVAVGMTFLFGGFLESGIIFVWALALVTAALVAFGDGRATAWLWISLVTMIGSTIGARFVTPLYEHPNPELGAVLTFSLVLIFLYFVLWYYVRERAELLRLSDGLLKNILPDTIASRLKASDEMIADDYQSASVLFADVVGLTPMSSDMAPTDLVTLVNEVFTAFDEMVEIRNLEKIKTIGDAYMVGAGVPVTRPDHAPALCDLALHMQDHVRTTSFSGHEIALRIGISSGPVVAGIIGRRKFSYDLWGDTVNTASRMESFGHPGRVQITEATRDLVADEYACEPGGVVDIKGKGPMSVWFLEGRQSSLTPE